MPPDNLTYRIREATAADVPALAALHVATFIETHGGHNPPTIQTREWQWRNAFETKTGSWFCLVIEKDDGTLAGFAKGQPYDHADQGDYAGELNKIYILRQYQKMGLGRRLICAITSEFLKREIRSMLLFGDAGNPSNGFYEKMGAEKLFAQNGEFHGGYGWRDLQKLARHCNTQPF